jgi:hypothetical protein
MTFLNTYNPATAYVATDAVSYLGSTYLAIAPSTGIAPSGNPSSATDWALLAQAGSNGAAGATGPQGAMGVAGPQGVAGATGPQGPAGPEGAAGTAGITFLNAYVNGTQYVPPDAVTYQGSTYLATAASVSVPPAGNPASSTAWSLLAEAGAAGPAGAAGASGGEGPAGPQGVAGPQGPIGPVGPPGQSAPDNVGTTSTNTALLNVIFGANNATPVGDNDTVMGVDAGMNLTTGREMTIVGAQACESFTGSLVANAGAENGLSTCIGSQAGESMVATGPFTSIDNVFVGQKAGLNGTSMYEETILGVHAGTSLLTGAGDIIIGSHTMDAIDAPYQNSVHNTIVGQYAVNGVGNKTDSVIVGWNSAFNLQTANQVTIVGTAGGALTTGQNAVLLGDSAGNLGTNLQNSVIIGSSAGLYTPIDSTIVGPYAGQNITAPQAVLFGEGAGGNITTGGGNTCAGWYSCGHLATGGNNTSLGWQAGEGLSGGETGNVSIGSGATTAAGVNNGVQLGAGSNSVSGSLQVNSTQVVDGNGDLHAGTVAPASNSACTPGAVRVVMPYVYACVAANTWMRAALSSY